MNSKRIQHGDITQLYVSDNGTLEVKDFETSITRAETYDYLLNGWSSSPSALLSCMQDCRPLSWVIHEIYSEERESLIYALDDAEDSLLDDEDHPDPRIDKEKLRHTASIIRKQLDSMPEEPEEGMQPWLSHLPTNEFKNKIVNAD